MIYYIGEYYIPLRSAQKSKSMKYSLSKKIQRSLVNLSTTLAIALGINYLIPVTNPHLSLQDLQAIASEPSGTSSGTSPESQQLLGQWEITAPFRDGDASDDDSLIFLFAPNGKLYLINRTKQTAIRAEYQINNINGKVYLDIYQGSFGARTSFTIDPKGKLIIQQLFIPAILQNSYNPEIVGKFFMPDLLSLTKVSSDTNLAPKLEFIPPQSPAKNKAEREAKTYVGTMNRAQQAVFLETGKFASTIAALSIGIRDESENYKYQIIVLDPKKAVQQISLPKKNNLKSYIGLVYTANLKGNLSEPTTFNLLCESKTPTKTPAKFQLTATPKCPEGYIDISN